MCKVISVVNQKGGVGKTTTTVNVGIGLAREGKKVLLIDADPQGSLTASLGYEEPDDLRITLATIMMDVINEEEINLEDGILHHQENVDLLPANIELSALEVTMGNVMSREMIMKEYIDAIRSRYDYILIDCMPSLGMMTINALVSSDSVLIPVQAAYLPVKGLQQLIKTILTVKKRLNRKLAIEGILLTMVDFRTNYARDIASRVHTTYGREIFDLALQGYGIPKIRKHINKQHILRPAAYAAERGETGFERYFEDNEENRYIWGENSIRNILRSPIYAGNLAGYKRISPSMKSRKRLSKLPEEWEVIPDTHEGIVTQEEFDTVQRLMTSRRREENAGGFKNIFAGIIKCADCGYALRATSVHRRKRPDIIDCVQYSCNNYARNGNGVCTAHNIEARDLFNAVLADINRFADMAVNDEKAVRAIEKRLTETDHSRAKALEKEQRKLNKRLAELDRLFSSLYEDKVMERITERNFEMMSGKYQKEQLEIEARLKEVSETLTESYEKSQGVRDFLSLIRNYQGIKELDATIINALIDKIIVSERETIADGTVRQEIKIYYKFIGFVGELHIIPTKRWAALKPKNCTVCGIEYVPNSGISKYCPECRERIRKVRGTEAKIRSRERNRQACIELSAKNDRLMWVDAEDSLDIF